MVQTWSSHENTKELEKKHLCSVSQCPSGCIFPYRDQCARGQVTPALRDPGTEKWVTRRAFLELGLQCGCEPCSLQPVLIQSSSEWFLSDQSQQWDGTVSANPQGLWGQRKVLHLPNPRVLVLGMHAQEFNLHKDCELSGRVRVWFGLVWFGLARSDVQPQPV